MSGPESRQRDEELLARLLEAGPAWRDELGELDAAEQARTRELGEFVESCRGMLRAEEELAERGVERDVVRRALQQTTREDLGWRGDLRLVRGFVASRLRDSMVLRFAAASLVAHVVALPLLATWVLREQPRRRGEFDLTLEHSGQVVPPPWDEEGIDVVAPPDVALLDAEDGPGAERVDPSPRARSIPDAWDIDNARHADRWSLAHADLPQPLPVGHPTEHVTETGTGRGEPGLEVVLDARSRLLHLRTLDERLLDSALEGHTTLVEVLRLEALLDALALECGNPSRVDAQAADLAGRLAGDAGQRDDGGTPLGHLRLRALRRAGRYGLLAGRDPLPEPSEALLDEDWRRALGDLLEGATGGGAVARWRAWCSVSGGR